MVNIFLCPIFLFERDDAKNLNLSYFGLQSGGPATGLIGLGELCQVLRKYPPTLHLTKYFALTSG